MDNILIVDDQENNRLVIEDILRRQPSSIRSVCSGKEALETVKEWVPDVMLIDHMMPELSGIETKILMKLCSKLHKSNFQNLKKYINLYKK